MQSNSHTIQKQEQILQTSYSKALNHLYVGEFQLGLELLYQILRNPLVESLLTLKYSSLLSAAEIEDKVYNNINQSIKCIYTALKIKQDYTLYKRLGDVCVRGRYFQQAEYSYRMALQSCPIHTKHYLLESLIDAKILAQEYAQAVQLIDQIICSKFGVERQKPKKLYCLKKLERFKQAELLQNTTNLEYLTKYDDWRTDLENIKKNAKSDNIKRIQIVNNDLQIVMEQQRQILSELKIKVKGSKSSWHSLIGQLYLMLKYHIVRKQQRKKTIKPKLKGLEQYFSVGRWTLREVVLDDELTTEEQDRNFNYAESYMNIKKRKNKETSTKLLTDEQEKKYTTVKLTGNIKDWISNNGIHVDSLVNLQAINKRKNLDKLHSLKKLNSAILPLEQNYDYFFSKISSDIDSIEVVDLQKYPQKGSEARPLIIQDDLKTQKSTDLRFQQDFEMFISKKKRFLTIFELARDIIVHFLSDRQTSQQSYSPHTLLESQQSVIINLLTKMYVYCHKLCLNLFPENSLLVPMLELLVERYGELLRKVTKNKDLQAYHKQQREYIRGIIMEIQCKLFNYEFGKSIRSLSQNIQISIKLRVYHSLAVFYSYFDQQIIPMANEMVQKYEKQLKKIRSQGSSEQIKRFWLSLSVTKPNLRQYIDNRIKQNLLKKQIDEKGGSLSDALSVSIQNFKKQKDKDVSEALELYYKSIIDLLQDSNIYPLFLNQIYAIFEAYLQIIERKPHKQDYSKYIYKIGEVMKIEDISSLFIKRTNQQDKKQNFTLLKILMKLCIILTKMNLQKLLLFQPQQQAHNHTFKGLLCAFTQLFRILDKKHVPLTNDITIMLHEMVHFSSQSSNAHKKINLHLIPKMLESLLKDSRINQGQKEMSGNLDQQQDRQTYKDNVGFLVDCYYGQSGKKATQFNVESRKDVENFVLYLKHFYTQYFEDPTVKLKTTINNVLRTSRKYQKQMTKQIILCPGFEKFNKKLVDWFTFDKKDELFLENIKMFIDGLIPSICQQQTPHEHCFLEAKQIYSSYMDVNFMVARSLQNEEIFDNQETKKNVQKGIKKGQKIYLELLGLDLRNITYWYCVSKTNKKKAYLGFDEIIYGQISNQWKNGFIAAKRIAAFMKSNLKLNNQISQDIQQDTLILNLLKIYERKVLLIESKLYQLPDREARKNKLIDAYNTVCSRMDNLNNIKNERIVFLYVIYCQYPFIKHTSFSSKQCITLINALQSIHQATKNKIFNQRAIISEDEIMTEIYFMIFGILKRYHTALVYVEKQFGPTDSLLLSGYKDLGLFLIHIVNNLDNLGKEKEEGIVIKCFEIGAKKIKTAELDSYKVQSILGWLKKLQDLCLVENIPPVIRLFNIVMMNLKQRIQQSYKNIQSKKAKLHRCFVNCCYYISKIVAIFQNNPRQGLKIINQITSYKSDDVIMIYRYYQNQSLQKDSKLAQFFNRNLFYFVNKNKIIKWVLELLWQNQQDDKILQLYRKFIKSVPKQNQKIHNKVVGFHYQITLKGVIHHLTEQLESGPLDENGERWMMQLYDKNIRKKIKSKDKQFSQLSKLVIQYYKRDQKYEDLNSSILEYERGRAILEEKYKSKKNQKQSKEDKINMI